MDADQPSFPLSTLTDAQLREYRRELEHSLKVISADAPVRTLLASKLFAVLGEQASRRPDGPEQDAARPRGKGEIVSNS